MAKKNPIKIEMVDFQNSGLEHQVFELISRMCDLSCSDEFPHFVTSQQENGEWNCSISIPGVKMNAVARGHSEVESINKCATKMMIILERYHNKNEFDHNIEDSIFAGNIEQYFDSIDYDSEYMYRLRETDVLFDSNTIAAIKSLNCYVNDVPLLLEEKEEIEQISTIGKIRLLIKKKKAPNTNL